ncbi:MAG: signal peptidase I [Chloroflexota bacterium]|nr:signal peptidase I [Chloroflexota bacterium]
MKTTARPIEGYTEGDQIGHIHRVFNQSHVPQPGTIRNALTRIPGWILVLALLITVYLAVYLALPNIANGFISSYVLRPLLWCVLIAIILSISRYWRGAKLEFTRKFLWIALLVGAFQVSILIIAGLFFGLGNSPYSLTPIGIVTNLAFVGTALVGMEFCRAYLMQSFPKRFETLALIMMALLFTAVSLPLVKLTGLQLSEQQLPFLGSTILPLLAQNLLACLLALVGGPLASIAYMGTIAAFEWFSPILPDLPWIITAFAGTIAAVIGLMVVQSMVMPQTSPPPQQPEESVPVRTHKSKKRKATVVRIQLAHATFFRFPVLVERPKKNKRRHIPSRSHQHEEYIGLAWRRLVIIPKPILVAINKKPNHAARNNNPRYRFHMRWTGIGPIKLPLIVLRQETSQSKRQDLPPANPRIEWIHFGFLKIPKPARRPKKVKSSRLPGLGWTAVAIVSVVIIWSTFGFFGFTPVLVAGHSMEPNVDLGDIVIVTDVPTDSITRGDIIQFSDGHDSVIHRVIAVNQEESSLTFTTKGDNNNIPDAEPVHPKQVTGKVVYTIPKIGWVSIWIKDLIY